MWIFPSSLCHSYFFLFFFLMGGTRRKNSLEALPALQNGERNIPFQLLSRARPLNLSLSIQILHTDTSPPPQKKKKKQKKMSSEVTVHDHTYLYCTCVVHEKKKASPTGLLSATNSAWKTSSSRTYTVHVCLLTTGTLVFLSRRVTKKSRRVTCLLTIPTHSDTFLFAVLEKWPKCPVGTKS